MTALIQGSAQAVGYNFEDDVVTKIADFMFAFWGEGQIRNYLKFPNLLEVYDGAFYTYPSTSYGYTCQFDFSKIEYIGHFAFGNSRRNTSTSYWDVLHGCSANLTIAAKTIGRGAFYYCQSLVNLSLPNWDTVPSHECAVVDGANTYKSSDYEYGTFYYCQHLLSVSAGAMVAAELDGTFYYCTRLESVEFPLLTTVPQYMFYYCSALVLGQNSFPNVEVIESYAFYSCSAITSVTATEFPKLKTINNYVFSSCGITTVSLPDATTIGYNSFQANPITSIYLPKVAVLNNAVFAGTSITEITEAMFPMVVLLEGNSSTGCFGGCTSLVKASFGNLASQSIYTKRVFSNCTSLTTVSFKKINSFSGGMFYGCSSLTTIILSEVTGIPGGASSTMTTTTNPFYGTPFASGNGTLYVPDSLKSTFQTNNSATWLKYFRNAGNQIKGLSELPT